jgi:hypothetical protein
MRRSCDADMEFGDVSTSLNRRADDFVTADFAGSRRRSCARALLRPVGRAPAMTLRRVALDRRALALEALGAVEPPLGHPAPSCLACRIARELCHLLAIRCVPQKFLGWIHGRSSWLLRSLRGCLSLSLGICLLTSFAAGVSRLHRRHWLETPRHGRRAGASRAPARATCSGPRSSGMLQRIAGIR